MISVLVVDDEEPFRRLLKRELGRKGYAVEVAADGEAALALLRGRPFDVILLDIVMPGLDGLATMKRLRQDPAAPAIIVLTGRATVETAVEAMKYGAFDYLTKPYKLDELIVLVNRAHEFGALAAKNRLLEQELVRQETSPDFVGESRQMRELHALIRKVAPTDSPVLILGESGTGKELVANAIWRASRRRDAPFIPLNCATLLRAASSSPSSSATSAGPSRARSRPSTASWRWRTRGRSSSTRSASCRSRCSRSSCASSTPASTGASAPPGRSASTCACSRRPTATCGR